jgi:diguanylate cyclase (GGDEF)-like protein
MRIAPLALALLLLARMIAAAEPASPWANVADPVFLRIDQKALPHPAVYAIAQDTSGFLWVGTPAGLARYDGHQFRSFRDVGVQALLADPRGKLWIGTPSSGLASFDLASERFQIWHPRSATVIALARAPDGRLWVGGDSGLDLFDPNSGSFQRTELTARVEAILVDREQTVWVATVNGLYCRRGGRFQRIRDGAFFSLYEDMEHRLWIGATNGVVILNESLNENRTIPLPGEQWGIIEVTPGIFWVAAYDGGISIVDAATQRVRRIVTDRANPGGLTPGDVWQFFRDRSGLIWIANGPGGLLAHNPLNRGIYEIVSRDKTGDIGARAIAAAADGALWLGGGDNIAHLDPRSGTSTTFKVPGGRQVQTLSTGASGTLWIGTMQGICRLRPRQTSIDCPSGFDANAGRVFAIVETGDTLWVGSGSGVAALDQRTGSVARYALSNNFVWTLYADRAGRIWAGTSNGVNRIDPRTGRVTRFVHDPRNPRSLGAGTVSSIVQDRRGRIWVGAVGGPLNVLTEQGEVRRVPNSENLAEIAEGTDGHLWAGAPNVLMNIDPDTFRARTLGPADGVQEREFWTRAVTASPDGTLFFAGADGVTVIAPDASAEWTYAPPVVVTSTRATSINLPAGRRDTAVEFAALDYSAPDALRYAYTLDSYNREWIETDAAHRVAAYTNLAPGNYTLRVRGTNRLGVWSSSTIALRLHALPAWYETWWFRALIGILLIAAIVLFIRARTAILRQRAKRLEAIVAERTSELAEANAALEKMTVTDALTGLRNRRFLMQRIDDDVELALRQETDLIFFLIDIDHFKAVNDELGHAAGDRVLQQMRERLEQVFRSSDYVLRWGGEEFLAVARGSRRDDAPEIAERLRVAIAERPFILDSGQRLPKTASIGFAAFPLLDLTWEQVVELADQALYMAKEDGRNTWAGFPAMGSDGAPEIVRPQQRAMTPRAS